MPELINNIETITAAEMAAVDTYCAAELGIASIVLMENAGRAVAECARDMLSPKKGKIVILCGMGNNGGDGLCAARHLMDSAEEIKVYLIRSKESLTGDPKINYAVLEHIGFTVHELTKTNNEKRFLDDIAEADLIIDALLGFGLKGNVRDPLESYITQINESTKPVLSIDIPSGLDATTGEILGCCIKAHHTVTFGKAKRGLLIGSGPEVTGPLTIDPIGIPPSAYEILET